MTSSYQKNYGTEHYFTEGGWEIHGNPLRHIRLNPAVSRVVHYCADPRPYESCHVWASLHGNLHCPSCEELMPDSIQTLWTLQNFDVDFSGMHSHLCVGWPLASRVAACAWGGQLSGRVA